MKRDMEAHEAMDSEKIRICSMRRRKSICVLWAIALVLASWPEFLPPIVWADPSNGQHLSGLEEGEVTGVSSGTLDVQGRTYSLHPKMTLKDDGGKPMEWGQLRPGLIVQYQLKEGALYKIIVIVPR